MTPPSRVRGWDGRSAPAPSAAVGLTVRFSRKQKIQIEYIIWNLRFGGLEKKTKLYKVIYSILSVLPYFPISHLVHAALFTGI